MWGETATLRENAMRPPSGLQVGWDTPPGPEVTRLASPPSATGMTQSCWPSSRSLTNAMLAPSGDQAGAECEPGPGVSSREAPVLRSRSRMVLLHLLSSMLPRVVT
jgi:hypothetical protein